jgi:molybdopterin-containing oxidoreductase family membrane subunit
LIFLFKAKNHIGWMVFACVLINVGMWLERYIVIVPSQVSPRLLTIMGQGSYTPTWTEAAITLACFSGMALLYALFTRFFPVIPIWETAVELPGIHEAEEPSPQTSVAHS